MATLENTLITTIPIVQDIETDKCLRNTDISTLKKTVTGILFNGSNPVLSSFRNFISAIKDEKDGTTISQFESNFNDILNKYQNDAIPKAKNEVSNKCQDDPNESDCIKVARKEFNKYRKPVKLEGIDCIIYRSANKNPLRKYEQLTPRDPQDATSGLSNFVNLANAITFIKTSKDPRGIIYVINANSINSKSPLKAIFDGWEPYKTGHISITPTLNNTITIDLILLGEWAKTKKLYALKNGEWLQSSIHPLTNSVFNSVIQGIKVD